jgi:hypothetical protein
MPDLDSGNTSGQSDRVQEILEEITKLMASTELEFEVKGCPPNLARIAVSRAQNFAQYRVGAISNPTLRAEAFLDTLKAELAEQEDWIQRQQAFLARQGENGNETE